MFCLMSNVREAGAVFLTEKWFSFIKWQSDGQGGRDSRTGAAVYGRQDAGDRICAGRYGW